MTDQNMTEVISSIRARLDALERQVAALETGKAPRTYVPEAPAVATEQEPRPTRSAATGRYEAKP
jgi:BMFP domain-containing protein YqiC